MTSWAGLVLSWCFLPWCFSQVNFCTSQRQRLRYNKDTYHPAAKRSTAVSHYYCCNCPATTDSYNNRQLQQFEMCAVYIDKP